MRRISLLMALTLIAFCLSCDKDSPTSPEEKEGTLLNSKTIGSGGGNLESDNFKLIVPAGAFSSNVELKLYLSAGENPFEGNSVTELFTIEGLPTTFSQPLSLRLKYQGSLTDSAQIAVGEEVFAKSLGSLTTAFHMITAKDSSGFLIGELSPPKDGGGQTGLFKKSRTNETAGPMNLQGVIGYKTLFTSGDHFRISSDVQTVSTQDVLMLGNFLEAAFDTIKAMGFKQEAKGSWPIDVTIKKLKDTVYGYSAYSMFSGGYMEFNSAKISDYAEMRLTAGHEFFHHVQTLYDPSWGYTKAKSETAQHWLDEAEAVWSEEKFTDQASYVSPIRNGNEMAPLYGAQKGSEENAGKHGYGMSAMIKYLVDNYGQNILVDIYDKISAGSEIIDAVESATDNSVLWYEKFLRQYILGKIYNVQLASWIGNKAGEFKIDAEGDTVKDFSGSYPDLSGKIYQIQLNYSNIDPSANLIMTAAGGTNEITVFKYRSGALEYIDNYTENLTISNVKKLKDDGWNLLVLVTNARSVSPFTGTSDINLKIRLTKPVWKICQFTVRCSGYYKKQDMNDPSNVKYEWSSLTPVISGWTKGYFNGNTFTGSWDTTYTATGEFDRGSITVTLNESRKMITSFHIIQTTGHVPGHVLEETIHDEISGINVPWQDSFWGPLYFNVEGSATCSHLTSVESVWEANWISLLSTLEDYKCEEGSKIEISFD